MSDRLRLHLVVDRALHYLDNSGTSWLQLLLYQQPQQHAGQHALPCLLARRRVGDGPAAQVAANSLAHHLRTGDHVVVYADAIGSCPRTGHLTLTGCTHLERLDPPTPQEQAAKAPTARALPRPVCPTNHSY